MDDRQKIIKLLQDRLQPLGYVHALWLEGSIPQGHADEYSDIDIWIGVDDDKVFTIFGDKVSAISFGKEGLGMIIESPQIAESMRQIFELAKAGAKARYPKPKYGYKKD
jgi:hypothetical protein